VTALRQRAASALEQILEAIGVELAVANAQPVARPRGHQRVRIAERRACPRHVDPHRLDRVQPGVLAPQRHGHTLGADRLVGMQQQQREQRPPLPSAQRHRADVGTHFQRTEGSETPSILAADAIASPTPPRP
jgi:hypothetical protein